VIASATRVLLGLLLAGTAPSPRGTETVTTELQLSVTMVEPIGSYSGTATVTSIDPRFILTGTVTWIQRPEVVPLGSEQAYAIHSQAQLLLSDWKPGDKRCFNLTRTRRDGRTSWHLMAAPGPRACKRAADR
jgi:hypothetical protein